MTPLPPLAFIGGGNMASAIISGAVDAGVLGSDGFIVADPDADKRERFEQTSPTAAGAVAWLRSHETEPCCGQMVLCVKPQMLGAIADELCPVLAGEPGERVVVSILAGTPSPKVRAALGRGRVVRVMPNTPAQIGRGMSSISFGQGATADDARVAEALFGAVGEVARIDESLVDAFTALAGSGPAYVFFLGEAMARAGAALGFEPEEAERIARQTVAGSGELLARSDRSAGDLQKAVTSKGGTTAAALGVFEDEHLMAVIERALTAARDRGRELAGE